MARLGIDRSPCPQCGSTHTIENQVTIDSVEKKREISLKCLDCGKETSYGIYKLVGNGFIKA